MLLTTEKAIILASRSSSRADLLRASGLDFKIEAANIDEATMRDVLAKNGELPDPGDVAEMLAYAKAKDVSSRNTDALVIGADQVLVFDGKVFEKPKDLEAARESLLRLRGRSHRLISAVCVVEGGEIIWRHVETAQLTMRDFSPTFLGHYLATVGEEICSSVGAYHFESLGVNLFSKIEGDFFTILGLPLLSLLEFLRSQGVIEQ